MRPTSDQTAVTASGRSLPGSLPILDPLQPNDPRQIHQYELRGRVPGKHASDVFVAAQGDTLRVLKLGPSSAADDDTASDRFAREIRNARRVRSQRVAEAVDSGVWNRRPYIVQEYVEGLTLARMLAGRYGRPMDDGDLTRLATGLAEALVDLDQAGVVHRDITPNNVVVHPERGVVVVDFGISRGELDPRRTRHGFAVGTPGYMSPEQLRSEAPSHAGDVFQWGLVVGQAMLGHHPVVGVIDPDGGLAEDWIGALAAAVPDGGLRGRLGRLVEEALSADPAGRPSAREILRDVDRTSLLPAPTATLAIPYAPRRLRDARRIAEAWEVSAGLRGHAASLIADTRWAFAALLAMAVVLGWSTGWLVAVLVAAVAA
jgi:serine/threonine protein kinase